jgi:pimeloyl-ACP methyl ester carboxylesterase
MTTESRLISYNNSQLHYVKAGNGPEPLLFFHGFGQDHSIYLPLIEALAKTYQLFIFDLYFHGNSIWGSGEQPLEKDEWKKTISVFTQDNKLGNFSLVGFSLGGKFALATLEACPGRVNRIFLLAPDGIKTSYWYSMATYPFLLRKFFKSMIANHGRFVALASLLNKLRIVDKGLVRFADFQMGTAEKRRRVYYSWVVFRHLTFNIKTLARLINDHGIRLTIIVGRFDKVIAPANMKKFLRHLKSAQLEVLESGHSGLIYESLRFIQHAAQNENREKKLPLKSGT